jgi:cell division protein FtsB
MTPERLKEIKDQTNSVNLFYSANLYWSVEELFRYIEELEKHAAEMDAEIQRLRQQLADCERDKNILAAMSDPPRLDYGSA